MIFFTLAQVNKLVKFEWKVKDSYFFLKEKNKDMYLSYTRFTFHNKNSQIKYTSKSLRKT